MDSFFKIISQFMHAELFILVPVLYVISKMLVTSQIANRHIPIILTALSVLLCGIYTFATTKIVGANGILLALFTSVTQGVLFAGATIIGKAVISPNNQLTNQENRKVDENEMKSVEASKKPKIDNAAYGNSNDVPTNKEEATQKTIQLKFDEQDEIDNVE